MIKRNHARTLVEDVAELIKNSRNVSMVEIMRLAGDEGKGDSVLKLKPRADTNVNVGNIFIWTGMSEELVDAITGLWNNRLIHPHPTFMLFGKEPMVYLGHMLKLPIVRNVPKNGYNKPHWLPAVFEPGRRCPDDPVCPQYQRNKEIG